MAAGIWSWRIFSDPAKNVVKLNGNGVDLVENSTEGALKWTPLEELLKLEMPYTLKVCLSHYLETGRYTQDIYLASVASSILENGNQVQFSTLRPCQQM